MSLYANRRIRLAKNVITYLSRQLANDGQLLVSVGQEVMPQDIIGRSTVTAGFRSVNVAQALEVSPKEAQKYLQRQVGKSIYKGELLAFRQGGLLQSQKTVVAPTDGVIKDYDISSGELKLEFLPHQADLPAAVFGEVVKVDQSRQEVIIKTEVTQIFGLFGTGKKREGIIKLLGERGELTNIRRITSEQSDYILVSGALVYKEAISAAAYVGVHGIITGGINSADYQEISGSNLATPKFGTDIGMSLLVCEGFGSIPIGEDIFGVIRGFENNFAILEGNRARLSIPSADKDCLIRVKKTQLPPIEQRLAEPLSEIEAVDLEVGQSVRIISPPFMGGQGVVEAIDNSPTRLPSQISTYLITVQTKTRKLRVPFTNVEVIG